MRTHPSSNPNATLQVYSTPELLAHFAHFVRVHSALSDYRRILMEESQTKGWPLVRAMGLHYPADQMAWQLTDQFMLGRDFVAAPIFASNHTRAVYLPANEVWADVWTGNHIPSGLAQVTAPIGSPPLYIRQKCSSVAHEAVLRLRKLKNTATFS